MALSCSKKISAILIGLTSKHKGNFYCLNCCCSFGIKNKLEPHKKSISQYQKSDKAPFIIYEGLECLLEKIDGCKKALKNYLQQKWVTSDFSMSTISSFKGIENKHDVYSSNG